MVVVLSRTVTWEVLWVLSFFSSGLTTPEGRKLLAKRLSTDSSITSEFLFNESISTETSSRFTPSTDLSNQNPSTGESLDSYSIPSDLRGADSNSKELLSTNATSTRRPRHELISAERPSGNVTPTERHSGSVTSTERPSGSVTSTERPSGSVTSTERPSGSVTPTEHPSGNVTATEHPSGNVTATEHPRGSVTATERLSGSVTATERPSGSVTATEHPSGSVTSTERPSGSVTSTEHPSGSVTATKRPSGSVTATEHPSGSVTATEHPSGSVTATKRPSGSVTATEHPSGSGTATEHPSGSVTSTERPSGSVTSTEHPSGSVTSTERPSGSVTSTERPSGNNTLTERPSGSVTSTERPSGSVTSTERPSGSVTSTERPSGNVTSTERPSGNVTSTERSSGNVTSTERPSGNVTSTESFTVVSTVHSSSSDKSSSSGKSSPISTGLRNDSSISPGFSTDSPIAREHPSSVQMPTHVDPKNFKVKAWKNTSNIQLDGTYPNKKELVLYALDSAAPDTNAAKLLVSLAERPFHKLHRSSNIQDDGTQKLNSRTVRETFEDDLLYETSENEFTDNLMVPSNIEERFEKWHQVDDIHNNAIRLNSKDQISPNHEQKTFYARKLEYTLPSTYAVLFKKVYSSKQGLSSSLDNKVPTLEIEMTPWHTEEKGLSDVEKIGKKGVSTENKDVFLAKESNQTTQTATRNSLSKNSQTTPHPFFDAGYENEYGYEDPQWEWKFDNKIDSARGRKGKNELQKKETHQEKNDLEPENWGDFPLGNNKLQSIDHLHSKLNSSSKPRQDFTKQRTLRNVKASSNIEPFIQPLNYLGIWKLGNSVPLQQSSSATSVEAKYSPFIKTESLISTDMLADSSLHDIHLRMKKQLKIDDTKPKLNSIYSKVTEKSSVLEKKKNSNRTSRNPLIISKQAGLKTGRQQHDFKQHGTSNPSMTSNERVENLTLNHKTFSQSNNELKNSLDDANKIRERTFAPPRKEFTESKPSQQRSSYSFVPQFENSAENNLDRQDYDQENVKSRAQQSLINDDVIHAKYVNSSHDDEEDKNESPREKTIPIVKYYRRPQASNKKKLSYKKSHQEDNSQQLPRSNAIRDYSKTRNLDNEPNKQPLRRNDVERVAPHNMQKFTRGEENYRRNDYDSEHIDYPQESRDDPKNSDDGAKHYKDYDLDPHYDFDYHTESEDYPVHEDDYNEVNDAAYGSERKHSNKKETDQKHNDRRYSTRVHEESLTKNDDHQASHKNRKDQSQSLNPHNHHISNIEENRAPSSPQQKLQQSSPQQNLQQSSPQQKPLQSSPQQSSQAVKEERPHNTPTLFDHAMQVAAATGRKLISPLLYLPKTQTFPEFESFGNFAKFG